MIRSGQNPYIIISTNYILLYIIRYKIFSRAVNSKVLHNMVKHRLMSDAN